MSEPFEMLLLATPGLEQPLAAEMRELGWTPEIQPGGALDARAPVEGINVPLVERDEDDDIDHNNPAEDLFDDE